MNLREQNCVQISLLTPSRSPGHKHTLFFVPMGIETCVRMPENY